MQSNVWFTTWDGGLFRWNPEGVSQFGMKEGLSSNFVYRIFEDREDNLWVITDKGLDVLQEGFITPYGPSEGITDKDVLSLLAAHDGST